MTKHLFISTRYVFKNIFPLISESFRVEEYTLKILF